MRGAEARRVPGRHPLLPTGGAGIELSFEPDEDPRAEAEAMAWRAQTRAHGEGWRDDVVVRMHQGGASVYLPAPADRLGAAASLLEWAAGMISEAELDQAVLDEPGDPLLLACLQAANGRPAFQDEDGFTLGLGVHSRTWPLQALPDPGQLGEGGERIPFAFVTGTNGKTTTSRLLARMGREAGRTVGLSSSDGVVVDDVLVERGDWTGPGAARRVLRDQRVDLAVLETARGGLLRRGLALDGADVAVVTNIDDDHLGEWGLYSLREMAWAKLTVAYGLRQGGTLVANLRCAALRDEIAAFRKQRPDVVVWWFEDLPEQLNGDLRAHADRTTLRTSAGETWLALSLSGVPLSFGGAARHNVENALAATLAAVALGIPAEAIVAGLRKMTPSATDSRGRANVFRLPTGARVVVDFAHNPDGIRRLGELAAGLGAVGLLVVLGQAGDRTDHDLQGIARATAALRPRQVYLKELPEHARGRADGEVRAVLRRHLVDAGLSADAVVDEPDEVRCVARAARAARDGEIVLALAHERVDEVIAAIEALGGVEG